MSPKKPPSQYNEASIILLEGLAPVRKRPGMYIGSTNSEGLHHLVWEILANAIDEVIVGAATLIQVTLFADHAILIQDNGRGIPVGKHEKTQISVVDTVFTTLHAGGKFGHDQAYQVAGGLHGVGASVVNALSQKMIVEVAREHVLYQAIYAHGGTIVQKLKKLGPTDQQGTKVYFQPDPTIFSETEFNTHIIQERLSEVSYLFPQLKIIFHDQLHQKTYTYQAQNGLSEYVNFINQNQKPLMPICSFQTQLHEITIDCAFQYVNHVSETIISFANSIKTPGGGSHVVGFKTALLDLMNDFGTKNKLFKPKQTLELVDLLEGLTAVISVGIPEKMIAYEGQTKNKLITPQAKNALIQAMINHVGAWLIHHKNHAVKIINHALLVQSARISALKAKATNKKMRDVATNRLLAGKLSPCQSKIAKNNELFLVEGESAGGSAKTCRERSFQAILPLKGKIINAEKSHVLELLKNDEVQAIINALGVGFGKNIDLSNLNYHKIIIMTDADNDGAHIQALLLTLFFRYLKPLIENGHIYLANPPLYQVKVAKQNQPIYLWTESELQQLIKKYENYTIKRFKGLGEMQPEQLWTTTMDPTKRQLIQVSLVNAALAERQISTLMGNDASVRKQWINTHIDFTNNIKDVHDEN